MQGERVHAAREHLARVRLDGVIGASETRDGVEQNDDIASVLNLPLGHLNDHFRHIHVVLRLFIEGGRKHHRFRVALHIRHFLRAFIDEKDDEDGFRMILRNGIRHLLKEHGLTDARRSDNNAALTKANGGEHIDDTRRELGGFRLKDNPPRWEGGGQVLEVHHTRGHTRFLTIHRRHIAEAEEAVAVAWIADGSLNHIACTQSVAANLLLGDEDILWKGEEVILRGTQEAVPLAHRFQAARGNDGAAACQISTNRGEDQLVLAVRAEFLRIRARHHPFDHHLRGPRLDIGEVVFGQFGVAARVDGSVRRHILFLGRQGGIQKRVHRL